MIRSVIALDPGDHTGWVFRPREGDLRGGTIPKSHLQVAGLLATYNPDVVVFETFGLYPGKANSLYWNSFYPCEVIGVIKLWAAQNNKAIVGQAPSVKRYSGKLDERFFKLKREQKDCKSGSTLEVTEHTKDAYMHLKYFERNREKEFKSI